MIRCNNTSDKCSIVFYLPYVVVLGEGSNLVKRVWLGSQGNADIWEGKHAATEGLRSNEVWVLTTAP